MELFDEETLEGTPEDLTLVDVEAVVGAAAAVEGLTLEGGAPLPPELLPPRLVPMTGRPPPRRLLPNCPSFVPVMGRPPLRASIGSAESTGTGIAAARTAAANTTRVDEKRIAMIQERVCGEKNVW